MKGGGLRKTDAAGEDSGRAVIGRGAGDSGTPVVASDGARRSSRARRKNTSKQEGGPPSKHEPRVALDGGISGCRHMTLKDMMFQQMEYVDWLCHKQVGGFLDKCEKCVNCSRKCSEFKKDRVGSCCCAPCRDGMIYHKETEGRGETVEMGMGQGASKAANAARCFVPLAHKSSTRLNRSLELSTLSL